MSSAALCLSCRRVAEAAVATPCATCGTALVVASAAHLEALIAAEVAVRLGGDVAVAVSDDQRELERQRAEAAANEARVARQAARERTERERQARYVEVEREKQTTHESRRERRRRRASATAADDDRADHSVGGPSMLESGAPELLASLDDGAAGDATLRAVLYENVGWFLGALLVLAGSVYGVREAWLTFGEVGRYLTVGAALFVYHLGFVALGALLAKRAAGPARVVSGIGMGLLPIVGAAFANLVRVAPATGALVGAIFLAASAASAWWAGRRLQPAAPWLIAAIVVPALLAELPLDWLAEESFVRAWLPLLALVGPLVVGRASPAGQERTEPLWLSLYYVMAVEVFALVVRADDGGSAWRLGDPRQSAQLALHFAMVGAVGLDLGAQVRWRRVHRQLFAALPTLGLAIALVALLSITGPLFAFTLRLHQDVVFLSILVAAIATLCATTLQTRHPAAAFAVLFASTIGALAIGRGLRPDPAWAGLWLVLAALPATHRFATGEERGMAPVAAVTLIVAAALTLGTPLQPLTWEGARLSTLGIGLLFIGASHARGEVWHYAGGAGAIVAWLALPASWPTTRVWIVGAGIAIAYRVASRFREAADARLRPLADIALLFCAPFAIVTLQQLWRSPQDPVAQLLLTGVVILLLASAILDQSAGVGAAALILATLAFARSRPPSDLQVLGHQIANLALVTGLAAALLAVRLVRPADETDAPRLLFGVMPLPFAARGRALAVDTLAITSTLQLVWVVYCAVMFLGAVNEATRGPAIGSAVSVIALVVLAFASSSHERWERRGRESTLWAAAAGIALAAIVNRIGRPLAPHVVGRNLSVILLAVWGVALAFYRWGPVVAKALGREAEGYRYHRIPHAGVAALGALLLFDAYAIGPPGLVRALVVTPPTFFLGPAIAALLLARSLQQPWLALVGVGLLAPGLGLVVSEHSLFGPLLAPLLPPGGQWVMPDVGTGTWRDPSRYLLPGITPRLLLQRFELGAVIAFALAAALGIGLRSERVGLSASLGRIVAGVRDRVVRDQLGAGAQWIAGLGLLTWFGLSTIVSAPWVALIGAAALVALASQQRERALRGLAPLALPWVVHAFAQQGERIPVWAGPVYAATGLILIGMTAQRVGLRPSRGAALTFASVAAAITATCGLGYALAALGLVNPWFELGGVIVAMVGSTPPWWATSALPAIFAVAAATAATSAITFSKTADFRARPATLIGFAVGVAALATSLLVWRASSTPPQGPIDLAWGQAVYASAIASIAVGLVLALATRRALLTTRDEIAEGARHAADLFFLLGLVVASAMARQLAGPTDWPESIFWPVTIAIATTGLLALGAALRRVLPFHMYIAQSAILVGYALVRAGRVQTLRPEQDALFLLVLGFVLVGAIVVARRQQLPPIAAAIRHFVAALPIVMGAVLPWRASVEGAALVAGSGLLYGAVGWVENRRVFGAAGTVAVNLALLWFAQSQGVRGVEVYCVPLGLIVLIIVHLFADELVADVRQWLRLVGSAFLYVPAAISVAFQVGNARDPGYALLFAGACVVGIVVGMVLHIRAYLFLGAAFFTLDVVANLVRASLRNQRLGFFLLSASGLAILGGMVFYTLKREPLLAALARLRVRLARWD